MKQKAWVSDTLETCFRVKLKKKNGMINIDKLNPSMLPDGYLAFLCIKKNFNMPKTCFNMCFCCIMRLFMQLCKMLSLCSTPMQRNNPAGGSRIELTLSVKLIFFVTV